MKRKIVVLALTALLVLILSACAGQPGGASASLPAGEWVLTTMNGSQPLEGSTVTISFTDGNIGGKAGCNSYGGKYKTGQDGLLELEEVFSTEMACLEPEGIMQQETTYLETLIQAASFEASADQLTIKNVADETILVFVPQK